MNLTEALQTITKAESLRGTPFRVLLACGITPLHIKTFLSAHLQKLIPESQVKVFTGVFGDLVGTLERELSKETQAVAVALEWSDLDARLGYRSLGGWGPAQEAETTENLRLALGRLRGAIERLCASVPVVVSLPTLPLPPAFHPPGWEAARTELEILAALTNFGADLASYKGVSVVNPQRLLDQSPNELRFSLKNDILTGSPYSVSHAGAVGAALAKLIRPLAPKKGLITDLDDTLWGGLVGEVGPDGVAWDLSNHAQIHGLYQQVLSALAEQGVLLAVASKNNLNTVEQAFARRDILIGRDRFFPMEVHWSPKSGSVQNILTAWNIRADSVVFVDDSPMELAEVKAAFPDIECLRFSKDDYQGMSGLLRNLRDLFGKRKLADEDAYRLNSIRAAAALPRGKSLGTQQDAFLSEARGMVTADFSPQSDDSRIIELVNKTNQFNLNGIRYTDLEWRRAADSQNRFLLVVSYEDKFGPLGKIAVVTGFREHCALRIKTWVMSCRAFSRRIEHGCLDLLFSRFNVEELHFDFAVTPKNDPLREFFASLLDSPPEGPFTLKRSQFEMHRPQLYYQVETR